MKVTSGRQYSAQKMPGQPNMGAPPPCNTTGGSAYTNGSVLQGKGGGDDDISYPGIGAAVHVQTVLYTTTHVPADTDTGREERTVAIKGEYREGNTIKLEVNTINRAELAAIKVALEREVAPELLVLLPDNCQTNHR
jgi:hypothetical protein